MTTQRPKPASLKYVVWKGRKAFAADLKAIYRAPTRELAETYLLQLAEKWGDKYAIAVRSWETHREELATMFVYTSEIRRLIYLRHQYPGSLHPPVAQSDQKSWGAAIARSHP